MASRPGAKKGVTKPVKRKLDGAAFAERLKAAMATVPGMTNAELARRIGATKQVVGKWLSGTSTNIDAILVIQLMRVLSVSGRWLVMGEGAMGRPFELTEDESKLLNVWRLMNDDMQEFWLSQGKKLLAAQPPPKATAGWPYKPELTQERTKLRAPPETN